jgi:hypothetical protein
MAPALRMTRFTKKSLQVFFFFFFESQRSGFESRCTRNIKKINFRRPVFFATLNFPTRRLARMCVKKKKHCYLPTRVVNIALPPARAGGVKSLIFSIQIELEIVTPGA